MDVIKSRYGKDRSIEKLGDRRIRVMGESEVTKVRKGKSGEISMFDFEGGPCLQLRRNNQTPKNYLENKRNYC